MLINLTVKEKPETLNKSLIDLHFIFILTLIKVTDLFEILIIINCF